jgi:transcriptional regulator with XRE-family HTH domain
MAAERHRTFPNTSGRANVTGSLASKPLPEKALLVIDDRKRALSASLKAFRARLSPLDVGLDAVGRRRVTGLRREELAAIADLDPTYYTRFERGERTISIRAFERVARALRLTIAESDELARLAFPGLKGIVAPRSVSPQPAPRASDLARLVDWYGYQQQAHLTSRPRGMGAALWNLQQENTVEFEAHIPEGTHLICAHLTGSIDWSCRIDDRRYDTPCLPGTFNIGRSGETATIRLSNASADFVHFYLPAHLFEECFDDSSSHPQTGFELLDPMNRPDAFVAAIAREVQRRMQRDSLPSRLEIEALGMQLAAHLIRRHSNRADEKTVGDIRLTPAQMNVVSSAMMANEDGGVDDYGTAELGALVGLTAPQFVRGFTATTGVPPHRWMERHDESSNSSAPTERQDRFGSG